MCYGQSRALLSDTCSQSWSVFWRPSTSHLRAKKAVFKINAERTALLVELGVSGSGDFLVQIR